jgi:hypothetical protein
MMNNVNKAFTMHFFALAEMTSGESMVNFAKLTSEMSLRIFLYCGFTGLQESCEVNVHRT